MSNDRNQTVIAIDLLRCIAAGLVVLHHFGAALPLAPGWQVAAALDGARLPTGAAAWTWSGWVGVELFFVISGLVIATSAQGAQPAAFLAQRAWRLLPAAWVCASLTAMALWLAQPAFPVGTAWLKAVLMLPTMQGVDQSYWSLSVEWAFYALVAAVLTGGGAARRLHALAMALGLASATFWATAGWLPARLGADFGFQMTLLPHGCFFALGMLLRRGPRWLLAILLAACAAEIAYHTGELAQRLHLAVSPLAPLALFAGGVALLMAASRVQPWLARTVGERVAIRMAAVTYPLYLLHQTAGAAVAAAVIHAGVAPVPAVALAIGTAVAAACVVAWRVEPAVQRWRRLRGVDRGDAAPRALGPAG